MISEMVYITEAVMSGGRVCDNFRYPKDIIIVEDRGYLISNVSTKEVEPPASPAADAETISIWLFD